MKAIVVLGVVGAALLVGTVTRMSHRDAEPGGLMPEVIVTAEAPAMLLDEVVVRPNVPADGSGDGIPDSAGLVPAPGGIPN